MMFIFIIVSDSGGNIEKNIHVCASVQTWMSNGLGKMAGGLLFPQGDVFLPGGQHGVDGRGAEAVPLQLGDACDG